MGLVVDQNLSSYDVNRIKIITTLKYYYTLISSIIILYFNPFSKQTYHNFGIISWFFFSSIASISFKSDVPLLLLLLYFLYSATTHAPPSPKLC